MENKKKDERQLSAAHNKYEYWFSALPGLPGRKKIRMQAQVPETEALYRTSPGELQQRFGLTEKETEALSAGQKRMEEALEADMEECLRAGIHLVCAKDREYPSRLRHIYNPPYGLYVKGSLPEPDLPAVAVVGARTCSAYGKQTAEQIGRKLAECGISVISGMALGVDGAGHRGALRALEAAQNRGGTGSWSVPEARSVPEQKAAWNCESDGSRSIPEDGRPRTGKTYGILGCGVDICYPAGNRTLYESLIRCGGVISEYPPGTQPLPMFFPQRNRLISGMSDAVIVVEAGEKSGALITADFALEQGREVYAVPGRITDAKSRGANRLIRQGAGIFLSAEDFLKEMDLFSEFLKSSVKKPKLSLEKSERLVYSCLDLSPKNLDALLAQTMLSFPELMENLESLRKKGCILEVYHNYYIRSDISDFA